MTRSVKFIGPQNQTNAKIVFWAPEGVGGIFHEVEESPQPGTGIYKSSEELAEMPEGFRDAQMFSAEGEGAAVATFLNVWVPESDDVEIVLCNPSTIVDYRGL